MTARPEIVALLDQLARQGTFQHADGAGFTEDEMSLMFAAGLEELEESRLHISTDLLSESLAPALDPDSPEALFLFSWYINQVAEEDKIASRRAQLKVVR